MEQLNNTIYNLSNDVSYNRSLIETGVHGNLDLLLAGLLDTFKKRMPCERLALAFIDKERNLTAETAVTSYNRVFLEPGHRESIGKTSLEKLVGRGEPRIINNLPLYAEGRTVSESTVLLLREGIKSSITIPMLFNGKCLGFFFVSSLQQDAFSEEMMFYSKRGNEPAEAEVLYRISASGGNLRDVPGVYRSDGRERQRDFRAYSEDVAVFIHNGKILS